jgi:hypothetical protein
MADLPGVTARTMADLSGATLLAAVGAVPPHPATAVLACPSADSLLPTSVAHLLPAGLLLGAIAIDAALGLFPAASTTLSVGVFVPNPHTSELVCSRPVPLAPGFVPPPSVPCAAPALAMAPLPLAAAFTSVDHLTADVVNNMPTDSLPTGAGASASFATATAAGTSAFYSSPTDLLFTAAATLQADVSPATWIASSLTHASVLGPAPMAALGTSTEVPPPSVPLDPPSFATPAVHVLLHVG